MPAVTHVHQVDLPPHPLICLLIHSSASSTHLPPPLMCLLIHLCTPTAEFSTKKMCEVISNPKPECGCLADTQPPFANLGLGLMPNEVSLLIN